MDTAAMPLHDSEVPSSAVRLGDAGNRRRPGRSKFKLAALVHHCSLPFQVASEPGQRFTSAP
jgi:hypothetical protein